MSLQKKKICWDFQRFYEDRIMKERSAHRTKRKTDKTKTQIRMEISCKERCARERQK
jgi:hypothetical protein